MFLKQIRDIFFSGSAKEVFFISAVFIFELVFILPASTILQRNGFLSSVLPAVLVDYANADRQAQNITPLRFNSLLSQAAQMKAEDMAKKGYFSHDGPNGEKPWVWLDRVGYGYSYAGENLAVDFVDSQDINNAWMNSPAHRANILKDDFQEIGIGVASGNYEGHKSVFVVQFFGSNKSGGQDSGLTSNYGQSASASNSLTGSIFSINLMWDKIINALNLRHSTWWQRIISSPCQTSNAVNSILILIILILLMVRAKQKHRFSKIDFVLLALMGLIIIVSILILGSSWFVGAIN